MDPPPIDGPLSVNSYPPDKTVYNGQSPPRNTVRAAGLFLADATSSASSTGGGEPSIAVNPANPNQVAITRFGGSSWNNNASVLYSTNGGQNWTDEASIPPPPGVQGTAGCPCDQTIDYGRDGRLYGTFLTAGITATHVVTGSTNDPTQASAWHWNGNPAQLTSGNRTNVDQPWLVVNRAPSNRRQDNVYAAYDVGNSTPTPEARVAVSYGADPVNITADNKAGGYSNPVVTNPGLRLAADHRIGTVYALYEQSAGNILLQPKTITYKLNRSTDGGATWSLNDSADGLTVDTVPSDQAPGYKFAGNNALLGGIDHAAVDPTNGDVYVVYGEDAGGNNRIKIRRLTPNGSGGLSVGPASNVSTSTNAALPSVAVLSDGTVGVLYDTFDGTTTAGFPIVSAHLARSTDHGATFSDTVLQTFQTPPNNGDPRQRVLGDYQQLKALGNTFHGVFAGNLSGVSITNPPIHAIYFRAANKSPTETRLSSSANPSTYERPVTFTDTVCPARSRAGTTTPTGTVTFSDDSRVLGAGTLSPGKGTHCSQTRITTSKLKPGQHSITAYYSGDGDYLAGPLERLTQVVECPKHHSRGAGSGGSCRKK
ncbi:Ig-like domain-containing protein [Streptomyces sp. NPDC046805]|uniref:Ig-like domain-containing protein n=1 Tax=Streptomyces sp. NPDC046805 TaxID=3155134 RepID=UPI0033C43EE0